jgi:lysophospholipase L1-like esterase
MVGNAAGRRRVTGVLAAVLTLAALAGCDDEDPSSDGSAIDYVAIGDSFTAAPKLPTSSTDGCFRSDHNYPHLVARDLPDARLEDVSCGGATTEDVLQSQDQGDVVHPPQIDAVSEDTDLVTVGLGANDLGVAYSTLYQCVQLAVHEPRGSPCADANADRVPSILAKVQDRLVEVLDAIGARAPDARILVIGYPRLLPESGACPSRLPIASGDVGFVRSSVEDLIATVEAAAGEAGVEYVDVATPSVGHDVCSADPWVNGRREDARSGASPYHPTPSGQQAVAGLILDALGSG